MLALLAVSLLWSCKPAESTADEAQTADTTAVVDNHTSQTSLDVGGVYKGVVPCADCAGIETEIALTDGNGFTLKMTYLGKEPALTVEKAGTYSWDASGNKIVLEGLDASAPTMYAVGEGKLTQLDLSGNVITGDLADKYVLTKQ